MLISSKSRSKPSTSTNAELLAPKVEIPRIQNSEVFTPGCPEVCMARTPDTFPANALERFAEGFDFSTSTSTFVTAPVTVNFFCAPVPVITTSSISLASDSFIDTLTKLWRFTNISCVSKPIYENTKRENSSIFIL